MRLGLVYACAQGYTHTEVATDAEAAPLAQLETVKAGARERLRGLPRLRWIADPKGSAFRLLIVCTPKGLPERRLPVFKESEP